MAFASSVGLGVRQASIWTSSRSLKTKVICLARSDARLFSTTLLPTTCKRRRVLFERIHSGSRSLSLWGWGSSSSSTTPPVPEPPKTPAEETTSSAATDSIASTAVNGASTPVTEPSLDVASVALPSEASSAAESITNSAEATSSVVSGLTDALTVHAPAALQYGDLAAMGLAGWSPAGIVRWSLEIINVSTGLPWFWTIVVGSAFWRLCCVPFVIKGLQASTRLQPHQKELMEMQAMIKKAQANKDAYEMQKGAVMMREFYRKHDINPFSGLISLVQMPITLGVFFGVQKLCKLPLEQLKDSGFSLLPDLTVPDPTFIMPVVLCAMVNLQITVGAKDINTLERPDMGHFMNFFRILTIPGIYFMAQFPSGLLLSLLTTAALTTVQTLVLRLPAVRRYFNMPIPSASAQGRLPPIASTFRRIKAFFTDDMKDKVEKARKEALERQQTAKRMAKRPPRL